METTEHRTRGAFFILAAAFLWGTTGTAQSFAPAGFDPLVIGFCRLLIGGGALFLLAWWQKELESWRALLCWPTFFAALFTAAYQVCFFAAVAQTGVAVGTIVGIGSAPIFGGLLGYLFRGENPGRRWLAATALAIGGATLLVLGSQQAQLQIDLFGLLLALAAGASYASYTLIFKGLLEKHAANSMLASVTLLGALILLPLLYGRQLDWLWQARSLAVVLHLGLLTMALSYWFFARGLHQIRVATAVTLSLAEPMTAGLLGVLVIGERLPLTAWCGLLLILSGLLLLTFRRRRPS